MCLPNVEEASGQSGGGALSSIDKFSEASWIQALGDDFECLLQFLSLC
jgi:hypothetical protein